MDLMLESTWGEKNPPSAGGGEGDGILIYKMKDSHRFDLPLE